MSDRPDEKPKDLEKTSASDHPEKTPSLDATVQERLRTPSASTPGSGPPRSDTDPATPRAKQRAADAANVKGRRVGQFTILDILGEGGMGSVYLAEQKTPVQRQVALKLITATIKSASAEARFNAERQAMARLSHPNIAQLFEAGTTEEGNPYFAMEHLDGGTITQFCDDKKLSIEARLKLFLQVCNGVQHAHQKGIIHRDIKPTNILVTEIDGEMLPKIIDFGIAKALDQPLTDATQLTGHRAIGTPSYMSPEALNPSEGEDVDTRTDVYALGILLYELIAGVRPFETKGASMAQVLMRIVEQDAPPPSTRIKTLEGTSVENIATARNLDRKALRGRLSGDLNWITLKAIAKDREHRYNSASDLAEDVLRHLSDLPVLASPPSLIYRVRKFVKRHKVLVVMGLLLMAAVVTGVITTYQQVTIAKHNLREAEEVSNSLVKMFETNNPWDPKPLPKTTKEVLDQGSRSLTDSWRGDPLLRTRLLRVYGTAYLYLRQYEKAEQLLTLALDLESKQSGPDHPRVAQILTQVGLLRYHQGQYDQAETNLRRAIEINLPVFGRVHPPTAESRLNLSMVLLAKEDIKGAREAAQESLFIWQREKVIKPLNLAVSHQALARVENAEGNLDQAVDQLRKAVTILEDAFGPNHTLLITPLTALAETLEQSGDSRRAAEFRTRLEKLRNNS